MFKEESGYFLCLDNKYQKQRRKENEPCHWSYIKLIRFKLNRALKALSLRSWSTRFQFESYFIFIIFKSQKQFLSAKKPHLHIVSVHSTLCLYFFFQTLQNPKASKPFLAWGLLVCLFACFWISTFQTEICCFPAYLASEFTSQGSLPPASWGRAEPKIQLILLPLVCTFYIFRCAFPLYDGCS